ncbi:MAG: hypothetical protein PV344_04065, partial [Anaplasma sp.]|nr:hypothetical protein [Anaplasma sp.]
INLLISKNNHIVPIRNFLSITGIFGYAQQVSNWNYCKRLNFRDDLIIANFANRLRFAKNRSREQLGQYVNTTEATFNSRKLEPANNLKFPALVRFAKI